MRNPSSLLVFQVGRRRQECLDVSLADGSHIDEIFLAGLRSYRSFPHSGLVLSARTPYSRLLAENLTKCLEQTVNFRWRDNERRNEPQYMIASALIRIPRAKHSATTAFPSMSSSIPCKSPSPRTSRTTRCRSLQSANPFAKYSPILRAWSNTRPSSRTRSTANPAAQASGLPPNVEAWAARRKRLRNGVRCQAGADRHAAAQPFRQGHDIRLHP